MALPVISLKISRTLLYFASRVFFQSKDLSTCKKFLHIQYKSFFSHDTAFKSHASIFKTDNSIMPDLIEKYTQDNLQYRDEEFTQQAEIFITKIAADKKSIIWRLKKKLTWIVPKELKAKFPLYQILISICKVLLIQESF